MITANKARKLVSKSSTTNWIQKIFCKNELRKVKAEIRKTAKKGLSLCYFKKLSKDICNELENSGFRVECVDPLLQLFEVSWIE